jgi:prevent-host-death family protein
MFVGIFPLRWPCCNASLLFCVPSRPASKNAETFHLFRFRLLGRGVLDTLDSAGEGGGGTMRTLTATEARKGFGALLQRAGRHQKPTAITRKGEVVAVLLSAEEWEDMQDAIAMKQAKEEWKGEGCPTVPWDEVKREAGLA